MDNSIKSDISRDSIARQVLGYYGFAGGYQPSGFVDKLMTLWKGSDINNKLKIRTAWPEYAEAFELIDQENGSRLVRDWAGIED